MIIVRDRNDRGHTKIGWLDSHHTFSFGDYYDPDNMGFGSLRVINDDRVIPGAGFPTHGHRDMEIISYVVSGALEHKDSMGTGSIIRPGDVQRMSAGTGVTHSEFNPSKEEGARLLQIWIMPEKAGLDPSYEQKSFSENERTNILRLVADRAGKEGAVKVHQDVSIYATTLTDGGEVLHPIAPGRKVWVQVVQGTVQVNDTDLREGDGAAVTDLTEITLFSQTGAEVLVFDLAA
jgi:hypothetical protein